MILKKKDRRNSKIGIDHAKVVDKMEIIEKLNPELAYKIARLFYGGVLRNILIKAIVDPKYQRTVDFFGNPSEDMLEVADKIFNYKKKGIKSWDSGIR